jgi:cytochrome c oxidase subunit 3
MSSQKTGRDKDKLTGFARIEKFHPYKTFLFFGLVGSAVLFLSLILFYVIKISSGTPLNGFRLPKAFFVSTIVMLFSSYGLSRTMRAFKNDQIKELSLALTATLIFSLIFTGLQAIGWYQLFKEGFFINSRSGVAFLYLITGLHLLHVLIGVIYLVTCISPVYLASKDMVKALVFFSDKFQQTKIELLNIYWHYVDFLWLCLFFMFLFTL